LSKLQFVALRGPLIDGSVRLDGDARAAKLLFRHSGLSWALMRGTPLSIVAAPATGERGPRYVVEYELTARAAELYGIRRRVLRQHLYPYAQGGPWAFTPHSQRLRAEGWWPVSLQLVSSYDSLGLPEAENVHAETQGPDATREPPKPNSVDRFVWALLAALAASGLALVFLRRAHTRSFPPRALIRSLPSRPTMTSSPPRRITLSITTDRSLR
jgi:hypothetical protein